MVQWTTRVCLSEAQPKNLLSLSVRKADASLLLSMTSLGFVVDLFSFTVGVRKYMIHLAVNKSVRL